MNIKNKLVFLLSLLIFMACSYEHSTIDNERALTYDDFKNNLKSDMSYNSITAKFGTPSKDIGSGIHIYVYELTDSSKVWIGYTDKIIYAKHIGIDQVALEDLIK